MTIVLNFDELREGLELELDLTGIQKEKLRHSMGKLASAGDCVSLVTNKERVACFTIQKKPRSESMNDFE